MDEKHISVFKDEDVSEFMIRLGFVLIELGIKMKMVESDEEHTLYSLSHAERLDGKKEWKG